MGCLQAARTALPPEKLSKQRARAKKNVEAFAKEVPHFRERIEAAGHLLPRGSRGVVPQPSGIFALSFNHGTEESRTTASKKRTRYSWFP